MENVQLTDLQSRILAHLPKMEFITLRKLADRVEMSSNQVRVQVRKLESLGFLSVAPPEYPNAALKIRLLAMIASERPNFDKLLINTRWV